MTTHTETPPHVDRPAETPAGTPFLGPRLRRTMAGVLAGLVVLALVAVALELLVVRPRYQEARAQTENRADVVRVAQQFMVEFNTYRSGQMDAYQQSMNQLLTTAAETKYKQALDSLAQLVQASKLRSRGEVLASGIASVDADSADVLVVGDAAVRSTAGSASRHFRWQVSLVKVDGSWLVDDFEAVP